MFIKDDKKYSSNESINRRLSEILTTILRDKKIISIERKTTPNSGWKFNIEE